MAKKPNGYDTTKEYGGNNFKQLPANGYVCIIRHIEEMMSKRGYPMLKVALDIAEGEYKDHFMSIFQAKKEKDPMTAKYPNDAIKYVMLEDSKGQCSRAFKSFCGALEKCGYTIWDSQDNFLIENVKGKQIGCTFGREESEWQGNTYWNCKPQFFCTIDDIHEGNFRIPDDKPLDKPTEPVMTDDVMEGFSKISDEFIPF